VGEHIITAFNRFTHANSRAAIFLRHLAGSIRRRSSPTAVPVKRR